MTWTRTVIHRMYYVPKHLESREDLPRILPPFPDNCDVCGKHTSELKPFGSSKDPRVADLRGKFLARRWRPERLLSEDVRKLLESAEKERTGADARTWFVSKYGEEEGESLYYTAVFFSDYEPSWECRDCFILDHDEYFEKLKQKYQENRNE